MKINNQSKENREKLKDEFCEIFKELINENRIIIRPSSYSGRGWIDIHIYIDDIFISDIGCSI
jgi:hypothetical protein